MHLSPLLKKISVQAINFLVKVSFLSVFTCLCPIMCAAQTKDRAACPALSSEDFCALSTGRAHKNLFAMTSGNKMLRKFCSPYAKGTTQGFPVGFIYACIYQMPTEWIANTQHNNDQTITLVARRKKKQSFICPALTKKAIQKLLQGHSLRGAGSLSWHLKTLTISKKIKSMNIPSAPIEQDKKMYELCAYHLNGLPINLYKNTSNLT